MTQNNQFYLFCNFSNLFLLKQLRMTWNGQFHLIHNFSNLIPPKQCRMTQSSQFHPCCNFSHLFPLKWCRMTWNGQNWWKLKYLNRFATNLHQTFRTGLIFPCQSKWVPRSAMLQSKLRKTSVSQQIINRSAQNFQNRANFSKPAEMSPKKCYAMIKADENLNISVDFQCNHEISRPMGDSMLL